jgi:hypothetical protein
MNDRRKTKEQLIEELEVLRNKPNEYQQSELLSNQTAVQLQFFNSAFDQLSDAVVEIPSEIPFLQRFFDFATVETRCARYWMDKQN